MFSSQLHRLSHVYLERSDRIVAIDSYDVISLCV